MVTLQASRVTVCGWQVLAGNCWRPLATCAGITKLFGNTLASQSATTVIKRGLWAVGEDGLCCSTSVQYIIFGWLESSSQGETNWNLLLMHKLYLLLFYLMCIFKCILMHFNYSLLWPCDHVKVFFWNSKHSVLRPDEHFSAISEMTSVHHANAPENLSHMISHHWADLVVTEINFTCFLTLTFTTSISAAKGSSNLFPENKTKIMKQWNLTALHRILLDTTLSAAFFVFVFFYCIFNFHFSLSKSRQYVIVVIQTQILQYLCICSACDRMLMSVLDQVFILEQWVWTVACSRYLLTIMLMKVLSHPGHGNSKCCIVGSWKQNIKCFVDNETWLSQWWVVNYRIFIFGWTYYLRHFVYYF